MNQQGLESQGLTRRAAGTVKTVFDDGAARGARVRAGSVVVGAATALTGVATAAEGMNLEGVHGGGTVAMTAATIAAMGPIAWASARGWSRIWAGPKPKAAIERSLTE